jgi:hypothetical protein
VLAIIEEKINGNSKRSLDVALGKGRQRDEGREEETFAV